jgi:hypothetical protein
VSISRQAAPEPWRQRVPPLTSVTGEFRMQRADEQRVLGSLIRRPFGRVRKRALQQRLHRLPAVRLNRALAALIVSGAVTRTADGLLLSAAAHAALTASPEVNRERVVRAQTDRSDGVPAPRPRPTSLRLHETRDGRLCATPAVVHGRRTLPPVGTSAWGRSLRAKKAAYARHQRCLALGIPSNGASHGRAYCLSRERPVGTGAVWRDTKQGTSGPWWHGAGSPYQGRVGCVLPATITRQEEVCWPSRHALKACPADKPERNPCVVTLHRRRSHWSRRSM